MAANRSSPASAAAIHVILAAYTIIALFPIVLVLFNAFKSRKAIFSAPLSPPTPETFSLVGFETVLTRSNFGLYFGNSLTVTLATLFLVVFLGAMAAWALSEYSFRGNAVLSVYLAIGIMIPIRLGTVSILQLVVQLNLINTLWALILAPGDGTRTITLGVQQFVGQYVTDWNAVLASLTLAIIPVLVLYAFFSRQLISGLTSGAVKG